MIIFIEIIKDMVDVSPARNSIIMLTILVIIIIIIITRPSSSWVDVSPATNSGRRHNLFTELPTTLVDSIILIIFFHPLGTLILPVLGRRCLIYFSKLQSQ